MSSARRNDLVLGGVALFVVLADQVTKHWIVSYFATDTLRQPIEVIPSYLDIEYLKNTGAAFSLFDGRPWLLTLFIVLALGLICYLYWRTRNTGTLMLKLAFGLVGGGAVGNLIDRFTRSYVVDFIHFQIPGGAGRPPIFDWPVFNVADSAISIGVVLLVCALWFGSTAHEQSLTSGTDGSNSGTAFSAPSPVDDVSSVGSHPQR